MGDLGPFTGSFASYTVYACMWHLRSCRLLPCCAQYKIQNTKYFVAAMQWSPSRGKAALVKGGSAPWPAFARFQEISDLAPRFFVVADIRVRARHVSASRGDVATRRRKVVEHQGQLAQTPRPPATIVRLPPMRQKCALLLWSILGNPQLLFEQPGPFVRSGRVLPRSRPLSFNYKVLAGAR
jgi:hypothetical protein